MSERDQITGAIKRAVAEFDEHVNRQIWGEHYTTYANPQPGPPLTFERLKQTYDYFKSETLTINGERHDIYGFKVHQGGAVPEGVIILTEKMKPGSTELGKLIMLFVNEGKGVIYDPAKARPEPPPYEMPRIDYFIDPASRIVFNPPPVVVSPFLPHARRIIEEKWPELICGPDDFFEVFDLIDEGV